MSLRLVKPGPEHEAVVMAYRAEFLAAGEEKIYGSRGLLGYDNFADWFANLDVTPPGEVKQTQYFSFDGEELIGSIAIRDTLNEQAYQLYGHIGYSVRPSKRRMGYAKAQLRLALDICAECGIPRALVTCVEFNKASAAVIRACGGVEDRPYKDSSGSVTRRFWIETGKPDYR